MPCGLRPMNREISPDVHTYRLKTWVLVVNVLTLVIFGLMFGGTAASMLAMMESLRAEVYGEMIQYSLLAIMLPLFLLMAIVVIQLVIAILQCFFSYIKITPEGIENKVWLARHIRARWSEVDRLGKYLFYDAVYLKSYEVTGFSPSYHWPWKSINFAQNTIAVSSYQGWPGGGLASDLKQRAPRLFEPSAPAVAAQDSTSAHADQEQRLLAALSHASVFFAGIGIVVPIVVYVTQQAKSKSTTFHALQALVYQLVGMVLTFLFPVCLVGLVFITAFVPTLTESAVTFEQYMGVNLIFMSAAILALMLGGIAFIIYGMIGAVQAYQGKDFRYALIGRWVEKRFPTT